MSVPRESERPVLELTTSIAGLVLRDMEDSDAPAFVGLVDRNRDHLMAGNGGVPPDRVDDVVQWVCPRLARNFQPGLWLDGELVGHITVAHLSQTRGNTEELLARSPNGWGTGYWLSADHTGQGYATEACRTLMEYVRTDHGAIDFYSGTFPHNLKSQAVLERLGFEVYKTTDEYVSYRLLERVSL